MTAPSIHQPSFINSFDERVEIICEELELAIQWNRTSILLAVYNSEYVRADAETALKNCLIERGQQVARVEINDDADAGFISILRRFQKTEDHIFFLHGADPQQRAILAKLGHHKDILTRKKMRLVIWLTPKALSNLAHHALDLWDCRQRVIEFTDVPNSENMLQDEIESAWQSIGEHEGDEAKIDMHESALTDLLEKEESASTHAKLLLTLGILNWRKGNLEKADELLQDAIKAAVRMEDNCFEAECFNAVALVKFAQGKNDEAIEAYKQAIGIAPEQIFVWNNLGNLCLKIARNDEAMLAFQKALKHNPKDPIAWHGLGAVYYRIGYIEDSINAYRNAIEYAPLLAQSWVGLGDAYADTGRDLNAITFYQKAIEINKKFIAPWLRLADIYNRQERYRDAIKIYQRALAVHPKNHQVWNELGLIFLKTNSFEDAASAFIKAIELDRSFGWAYSNLALAYANQEKYLDAIEACKKSLQVFTEEDDKITAWDRLANFYRFVNDYDNAMQAYQTVDKLKGIARPMTERISATPQPAPVTMIESPLEISPECIQPKEDLVCEEVNKETSPAMPAWIFQPEAWCQNESIATTYPENLFWKEELPDISLEQINTVETPKEENLPMTAQQTATSRPTRTALPFSNFSQKFQRMDSFENKEDIAEGNDPEVWNEKGNVHFQNCEYENAIAAYNKAIELDRSFGWPYSNLAQTYLAMGKYAEAILLYQRSASLLETKEEKAAAWNSVGTIYRHLNEYESALSAYQKADELDSQNADWRDNLEAARLEPNSRSAQVWIELGNLFFKSASYKEAEDAYANAVKIDPASGWAHGNLAMSLVFQGKYTESVSVYLKSIDLFTSDKDKAVSWNRLGTVYRKMNDEDNARKAYQHAVVLSKEKVNLLTRTRFSLLSNCYSH